MTIYINGGIYVLYWVFDIMVATQCHVIFHSTYVVLILDIERVIILLNCYIYRTGLWTTWHIDKGKCMSKHVVISTYAMQVHASYKNQNLCRTVAKYIHIYIYINLNTTSVKHWTIHKLYTSSSTFPTLLLPPRKHTVAEIRRFAQPVYIVN